METVLAAESKPCPSEFSSAWEQFLERMSWETWLCVVSDLYHALAHPAVTLPPATDGERTERPSQYLPSPEEERALREKNIIYFLINW